MAGESIKYLGRTDDGILALSNYRIFLSKQSTGYETYVPLGLIESVQVRDLFQLIVNCKDASTVRCSFPSAEQCSDWQRRIHLMIGVPESLETLFAFPFYSWTCDVLGSGNGSGIVSAQANGNGLIAKDRCLTLHNGLAKPTANVTASNPLPDPASETISAAMSNRLQRSVRYESDFKNEVARLGFDLKGSWRISTANADFKLCPSYPPKLLVPCCITDEMLHNVANFRGSRRLPAVVWRHQSRVPSWPDAASRRSVGSAGATQGTSSYSRHSPMPVPLTEASTPGIPPAPMQRRNQQRAPRRPTASRAYPARVHHLWTIPRMRNSRWMKSR